MDITIRRTERPEGQTLQEYRAAQARAWLLRNQRRLRAEFWARQEYDRVGD